MVPMPGMGIIGVGGGIGIGVVRNATNGTNGTMNATTTTTTTTTTTISYLDANPNSEFEDVEVRLKWNHIVIWHAVFWLLFRNTRYLLNFSLPL